MSLPFTGDENAHRDHLNDNPHKIYETLTTIFEKCSFEGKAKTTVVLDKLNCLINFITFKTQNTTEHKIIKKLYASYNALGKEVINDLEATLRVLKSLINNDELLDTKYIANDSLQKKLSNEIWLAIFQRLLEYVQSVIENLGNKSVTLKNVHINEDDVKRINHHIVALMILQFEDTWKLEYLKIKYCTVKFHETINTCESIEFPELEKISKMTTKLFTTYSTISSKKNISQKESQAQKSPYKVDKKIFPPDLKVKKNAKLLAEAILELNDEYINSLVQNCIVYAKTNHSALRELPSHVVSSYFTRISFNGNNSFNFDATNLPNDTKHVFTYLTQTQTINNIFLTTTFDAIRMYATKNHHKSILADKENTTKSEILLEKIEAFIELINNSSQYFNTETIELTNISINYLNDPYHSLFIRKISIKDKEANPYHECYKTWPHNEETNKTQRARLPISKLSNDVKKFTETIEKFTKTIDPDPRLFYIKIRDTQPQ